MPIILLSIVCFIWFYTKSLMQNWFSHAPRGPIWPYFRNIKFAWPPLQLIFLVRNRRCNGYVVKPVLHQKFCVKPSKTDYNLVHINILKTFENTIWCYKQYYRHNTYKSIIPFLLLQAKNWYCTC